MSYWFSKKKTWNISDTFAKKHKQNEENSQIEKNTTKKNTEKLIQHRDKQFRKNEKGSIIDQTLTEKTQNEPRKQREKTQKGKKLKKVKNTFFCQKQIFLQLVRRGIK